MLERDLISRQRTEANKCVSNPTFTQATPVPEGMPMITPKAFIESNLGKTVISIISADYCDYERHKKNNDCGLVCGECNAEAILNAFCEAGWIPPEALKAKERAWKRKEADLLRKLNAILKTGNIDPVYETLEAHIAELEGK